MGTLFLYPFGKEFNMNLMDPGDIYFRRCI